jgi:uncharacterized protein YbgA (DUF1722 family)/uncharacterized protein YbbK (DUF523 family)
MIDKIRLGISSCLLGNKVRYDGGHKLDHFLSDALGKFAEWLPVCPEVEMGLDVPREAMRLVGRADNPKLITIKSGRDYTGRMLKWADERSAELEKEDLCGFVFKARSPSSGMRGVKVYNDSGVPWSNGIGLFARVFMERFPLMPVEDEGRLNDPGLRENFIERIFVFKRWKTFLKDGFSSSGLLSFHTRHKLLILSHSTTHYSSLGRLIAGMNEIKTDDLKREYILLLLDGLKLRATIKKNTNVLQHMAGYFKKRFTQDEKKELTEVIAEYHNGLVPLIVPVTLIRHYVRKYDDDYLKDQAYLNPHPAELMLRNHV